MIIRKILAVVLGVIATFICLILQTVAPIVSELAESFSSTNAGTLHSFSTNDIEAFYFYFLLGFDVAIGFLIAFSIWNFQDKQRRRLLIYVPFLFVILCFTSYNYSHGDMLIRPAAQVIFNFILIFLSLVCTIQFWKIKPEGIDLIILKYFLIFLIVLAGLLLPTFFSVMWALKMLFGLKGIAFDMSLVTGITSILTTAITVMKYRDDKKVAVV